MYIHSSLLDKEYINGEVGVLKMTGNKPAEEWVPVRSINNGIITLDNGYMVAAVKVEPKNIFILDQQSRYNIINSLRTFYNNIDFEFWLICAGRPVDINVYLASLQVQYNNTNNPQIRKLLIQDINKANMFMSTQMNAVDTEYYILFKEKRPEIIQKRLQNLISGLATCTLNGKQASNDDLRMLIDNFFNGAQKTEFGTVGA